MDEKCQNCGSSNTYILDEFISLELGEILVSLKCRDCGDTFDEIKDCEIEGGWLV